MKKYILAFILFYAISFASAQTSNTWIVKSAFGGTARSYAIGFSIGNKGYIGLGIDAGGRKEDFWEYDPTLNIWTQKANFGGGPRSGAVGFSIGNKGYAGTGYHTSYNNDFWEYNPGNNTWTLKASLPVNRNLAVGFSIGNKGYIGTGQNASAYLDDFWEYDPTMDSWTSKSPFGGTGRFAAVGFSIGTKGYIGTGWDSGQTQDFWEYDQALNSWIQKANFGGYLREYATGFSITTKGYIGTGYGPGGYHHDLWEYDPATNLWIQKALLGGNSERRYIAAGFSIGNKGYIGTGSNTVNLFQDFWEYTPTITATLTTNAISGSKFCASDVINLSYTVTGIFGITNIFTAQLSDASGNFSSPINIGSVNSTATGVISATIPSNTISGTGYRIRIVSSDPVLTSNDNGSNITIYSTPVAFAFSNAPICSGTTLNLSSGTGTDYSWTGPGSFTSPFQNPSITNATSANAGTYNVNVSEIHNGNSWTQKTTWAGASRFHAVAFSIGDKGYFGTGYDGSTIYNDLWEYNPLTNAWTQKAAFTGGARSDATGFSIGSKGYIGLGANGATYYNDFWEYDPALNQWTSKAAFGGVPRIRAVGFGIGTKGYIGTGETGSYFRDFWEYNPATNAWTPKADFGGIPRGAGVGFSIGSKGYIGTGWGGSHNRDFWEYNPATNSWLQKASFGGIGREFAAGFSIGDKGYIGTGADAYLQDFWEYNSQTDIWTQRANFGGGPRYGAFGFAVGSRGYIGGGKYTSSILNDFWEYTPPENVCSATSSTLVQINPSPTLNVVSQTDASCPSTADGSIDLDAVGGTAPFIFEIEGNSNVDGIYTNLTSGTHTATVTDANGCTGSLTITVNSIVPTLICSDAFVSTNICPEESFIITANFSGGIGPYSYAWNDHGANGGPYSNTQTITANLPIGHYLYSCIITDACGQTCTSTVEFKICDPTPGNSIMLNLKFFIQGYYIGGGIMTPVLNNSAVAVGNTYPNITDVDTVNVALHDPSFPYALVDCALGIVDVNGNCTVYFPNTFIGQSYYISICNRNLLQTTTANPVTLIAVNNYNFTDDANKAYGSTMINVGTSLAPVWAFYNGDLNHDCIIDALDYDILFNDWNIGYGYLSSDLNGDGYSDINDYPILDQNSQTNTVSGVNWCCECTNIICVSLTNCPDTCSMDTLFINTGIEHFTNTVIGPLQRDRFWKLVSTPSGILSTPEDAWRIAHYSSWHPPLQNEYESVWIGNSAIAGNDAAYGEYDYEFYFCLKDTDGLSLELSFLADNLGVVNLNGTQILTTINGSNGFSNEASSIVSGPFIPNSRNVIRVEIANQGGPSGFNIAGRITSSFGSIGFPGCCCSDTNPPVVNCGGDITICYSNNNVYFVTPTVISDSCCLPVIITNNAPAVFPVGTTVVTWTGTDACGRVGTCVQNVTKSPSINVQLIPPLDICIGTLGYVYFTVGGTAGSIYSWSINPGNVTGTIGANSPLSTDLVFGAGSYTLTVGDGNVFGCSESVTFSITEHFCQDTCDLDTFFINSGIEHITNATLGIGMRDRFWKLISIPSGPLTTPQDAWTLNTAFSWSLPIQNQFGSTWIGDNQTADALSAAGDYVYEFYFCLHDTVGLSLDLNFLADNSGIVSLNGTQILTSINTSSGSPFTIAASAIVRGLFFPNSENILRVVVHNGSSSVPTFNPCGFNIAGRIIRSGGGIGFQGCCCSDTIPPVVQCGQDITICYSDNTVYFVTPTVTSDSCCLPVTLTNDAPGIFPVGITAVTWTAIDACGRVGTCVQNVTKKPSINIQVVLPINVCIGATEPVSFSIGGTTGTNYTWSINPGSVTGTIGGNSVLSTLAEFGAGTYTLIVGDGNIFGCSESIPFSITEIVCPDTCNIDTLYINTGIDHITNTTLAIGSQDRFWKLTSIPTSILTSPINALTIPTHLGWGLLQNAKGSMWIGPTPTADADAAPGDYVYEFDFCLHDTTGLYLDLSFLSDNDGIVKLNGTQILSTTIGISGFATATSTIVRGPFIPNSRNVLRVEINNVSGPSGLNIAGRIFRGGGGIGFHGCCCDTIPPVVQCGQDVTICHTDNTFILINPLVTVDSCCLPVIVTNDAPPSYPVGITPVTWTATDACGRVGICVQNVTKRPSINIQVILPIEICIGTLGFVSFSIDGLIGTTYNWTINPGNVTGTLGYNSPISTDMLFGAGTYTLTVDDGNIFGCSESVTFSITEIPCLDTCNMDTLFINTGIEHINNTTLNSQQVDEFWKLISAPSGTLIGQQYTFPLPTATGWHSPLQNEHGSKWIGAFHIPLSDPLPGDYVYEFYFCLHDTAGLTLDLKFLADNRGIVKLNGTQILTSTNSSSTSPFNIFASAIVRGIFIPNSGNVLRVEVHQGSSSNSSPNPSGFNIAGRIIRSGGGIGFPGCCCAAPPVINCKPSIFVCFDPVFHNYDLDAPTATFDSCCIPVTITNNAPTIFPLGFTFVTWTATDACGKTSTCVQFVNRRSPFYRNCGGIVYLGKMFMEGYYLGNRTMNSCLYSNGVNGFIPNVYSPTDADSVVISMMDPITFTEVDREIGILQSNGDIDVTFSPAVIEGNSYYIKINHRNSIETWSSFPVLMDPITNFDFASDQSQAYGNNMIDVGTPLGESPTWAIFSGDISDASTATVGSQDGIIESQDYGDMENAVYLTLLGYVVEDITGDGVVESADYGLMENNVFFTRVVMRP